MSLLKFILIESSVIMMKKRSLLMKEDTEGKSGLLILIITYKTLKLKPGALARSTAFAQIKPGLKAIYQKYYQGQEKSFIELLELTAEHNLVAVEQAITVLEKINPSGVSTEKIRTILERKDDTSKTISHPSDIETQAKKIVNLYANLLKEVSV